MSKNCALSVGALGRLQEKKGPPMLDSVSGDWLITCIDPGFVLHTVEGVKHTTIKVKEQRAQKSEMQKGRLSRQFPQKFTIAEDQSKQTPQALPTRRTPSVNEPRRPRRPFTAPFRQKTNWPVHRNRDPCTGTHRGGWHRTWPACWTP